MEGLCKEGTVYPVLRSLCDGGFLKSRVEPSSAGPPRRYYRITPAGRRSLGEEQEQWNLVNRTLEALWTPQTSS